MGRPIRIQEKRAIHFVTNRCFQQRFLFRPSKEVNRIILGCLAREAAKHHVRLFAFVFMSNHFHMLLQAFFLNLPEFMRDFQPSVARDLNRLHGRDGKLFERRYSSEPVLDDEAFLDRLNYTLNNPCNDDLVRQRLCEASPRAPQAGLGDHRRLQGRHGPLARGQVQPGLPRRHHPARPRHLCGRAAAARAVRRG
jgi:REP element-mobilizing transposase RayT